MKAEVKKIDLKPMYQYLLKKYEPYDPSVMVTPFTKTHGILNMLITRNEQDWSLEHQDDTLLSLLKDHERNVQVIIDPIHIA